MAYRWLRSPKALVFTPIVLLLLALVACGSTAPAEPVVVEKEVIKEVIKEVPIEKEVIKEVEKKLVVTRAAPTAIPKWPRPANWSLTSCSQCWQLPPSSRHWTAR